MLALRTSSEAMGSSASRIFGCWTSARAIATRCCCPPESSSARWRPCDTMSRRRSAWMASWRSSAENIINSVGRVAGSRCVPSARWSSPTGAAPG